MGLLSRRKGARWERELVQVFGEVFGKERVRRGLQSRGGTEVPDVEAPCFWIEAKCGKRTNPRAALAQAIADSDGQHIWPLVVCKDDREDPFVVMRLADFVELASEWWRARSA